MWKTLFVSFSRIIILLIPFLGYVALSNENFDDVGTFTVSNQFIQIIVIILVAMSIGINILIPKSKFKNEDGFRCLFSIFISSIFISIVFFFLSKLIFSNPYILRINNILLLGLPFLSIYISAIAILESRGFFKTSFTMSLISVVAYCIIIAGLLFSKIDLRFIIPISFTAIRILQALLGLFILKKIELIKILSNVRIFMILKEIMSYCLFESLSLLLFTASIFYSLFVMELNEINLDIVGITLSFIGVIAPLFLSYSTAYTILKSSDIGHLRRFISKSDLFNFALYLLIISVLFILLSNFFASIYNIGNRGDIAIYFRLSVFVLLFDAIGTLLVAHFRIKGFSKLPPLTRFMFIFIGLPIGVLLSVLNKDALYYVVGMLIGNILFVLALLVYYLFLNWHYYSDKESI